MSQENVDLAHGVTDAFNRRDLEAFLALADPDVEAHSRIVALEGGGPFRGHDGVREWWSDLFAIFPDFHVEVEEIKDLGELTVTRMRAHTGGMEKASPADQTQWHLAKWRDGKTVRWQVFLSEDDALKAAGLSE